MRNQNRIVWLWLAMVVSLLAATPARAFYNPQTGHWLNRDPLADRVFIAQYFAEHPDIEDNVHRQIINESLSPLYAIVRNNPVNSLDCLGLLCSVVVYMGHNTTVPQGSIDVGKCSAAAVVSCGSNGPSNPGVPTVQIPGTSPTPFGEKITIAEGANIALKDFGLGVAYAKSLCANNSCKCLCKTITVRIECSFGSDLAGIISRMAVPAGVCGKTQTITCGP